MQKLVSIALKNFKGIPDQVIEFGGRDTAIYGCNGSGKSTIMDAYPWCLTGKDANDRKDFQIKPLDQDGRVKDHHAVTSVTVTLSHSGQCTTFRKEYQEKWTKRHGAAESEFTGHETRYFVDDLEVKSKRYEEELGAFCDKTVFRMLSNPLCFNQLEWKERRRILSDLIGNLEDAEIAGENPDLTALLELAGKHSVEDYRKLCTDRRKAAVKLLDDTASRLAEQNRQMPEAMDLAAEEAAAAQIQAQIDQIGSGAARSERDRLHRAELRRQDLQHERDALQKKSIADDRRLLQLRVEWNELKETEWSESTVCPTCSQPLPADAVEAAKAKFYSNRAELLQANEQEGKALAAEISTQRAQLETLIDSIATADAFIADLEERLQPPSETGEESLRQQLAVHQANIVRAQERAGAAGRIAELEEIHRRTAAELESLELSMALCDQFARAKAAAIEGKVNDLFQYARFILFRQQVNGEIAEICEATFEGVPYADLNTAAKINIGLDIITTLSRHYGVSVPIFIDNAESVTQLLPVEAQVIRLVVSEADETLRIEMEESTCKITA